MRNGHETLTQLLGFSLTVSDLAASTAFYCTALGFTQTGGTVPDGRDYGVPGSAVRRVHLVLGQQAVELVEFDPPGAPYPSPATSHDPWFQHLAIVTSDMPAAYAALLNAGGWSAITTGGPQTLPPSSGGVAAFKFRDPDGHPLELLAFADGNTPAAWRTDRSTPTLGIDHSAIVVADTRRALDFYRTLGLGLVAQSLNTGPAQACLDAAKDVEVEVTAIASLPAAPHLELLCYRAPPGTPPRPIAANDLACTRTVLHGEPALRHDPDGHALMFRSAWSNGG